MTWQRHAGPRRKLAGAAARPACCAAGGQDGGRRPGDGMRGAVCPSAGHAGTGIFCDGKRRDGLSENCKIYVIVLPLPENSIGCIIEIEKE